MLVKTSATAMGDFPVVHQQIVLQAMARFDRAYFAATKVSNNIIFQICLSWKKSYGTSTTRQPGVNFERILWFITCLLTWRSEFPPPLLKFWTILCLNFVCAWREKATGQRQHVNNIQPFCCGRFEPGYVSMLDRARRSQHVGLWNASVERRRFNLL